jgi:AraC-like DNA-binding protein
MSVPPDWLAIASTMPVTLSSTPSGALRSLVSIGAHPRGTLTTARLIRARGQQFEVYGIDAERRVNNDSLIGGTAVTEGASRQGPTVTSFAINRAIAALRKHNVDPLRLLNRAGLSEHCFDDRQARVSALGQARFLEYSAEALGDTAFGLHLAEQGDPRDGGLLFYLGSAARNLGEAMTLLARYFRIADESVRMKLAQQAEGFKVEITFVGLSRHLLRQQTEFGIAMIVKAMRAASGYDVRPTRVRFAHIRPSGGQEFERFFGCSVEFGAPSDQLEFSNETLALPLITADPLLLEVLRPFCEEAARTRNTAAGSHRALVENEVQRLLPQGRASAELVAKALAVSVRTLSRRLSEEGTTFAEVVDQLRRSLALQ